MECRSAVEILLQDSASNVQAWFETRNLLPSNNAVTSFLDEQTWASATHMARATEPLIHYCIDVLSNVVPENEPTISELLHLQLAPACMSGWVGARSSREAGLALGFIAQLRCWAWNTNISAVLDEGFNVQAISPAHSHTYIKFRPQAISYVVIASLDICAGEVREDSYRLKLARIRSALAINSSELANLLRVSREAIRKWDRGDSISAERWADIDQLFSNIEKLQEYINPEKLPAVVRRPIPALQNQTPLDLLASRRSNELLALYEGLTSYQTAI